MNGKISRKDGLVYAQAVGFRIVRRDADAWQRVLKVGPDQMYSLYVAHTGAHLLGSLLQIADAVCAHPDLDGVGGRVIVHLLEAHTAVGEVVRIAVSILVEHLVCGVVVRGVDNELRKVRTANLWCVGGMEAWRSLSDERRHGGYQGVALQDVRHRVCHLCRLVGGSAVRKIKLHGKLVAFGYRHHSLRQTGEQHGSYCHQCSARQERDARIGKAACQQPCIAHLQIVERLFPCVRFRTAVDALVYHSVLQVRREQD